MVKKSDKKEKQSEEEMKKVEEDNKKNLEKKQNRQVLLVIIFMVVLVVIVLLVPYVKKEFFNKFEYANLPFYKTKQGQITFYSARIPLVNNKGESVGNYAINMREDPRSLDNITVNIPNDIYDFHRDKTVYISLASDLPRCADSIIGVTTVTDFLSNFGNMQIKAGISNQTYAKEQKFPYITCQNSPNNTVILYNYGINNSIVYDGKNCYVLTYNECNINRVSEKFVYQILNDYMNKYVRTYGKVV